MRGRFARGAFCVALAATASASIGFAAPEDAPVADAAMRGTADVVRSLLREGADVNVAQGDGMTALHWAAANGNAELAGMLLYAGANHRAGTRIGQYTPLHLAAQAGHTDVIARLLEAGADANAATSNGGATALHFAAAVGSVTAIERLIEHGADVRSAESAWGQTPLMFAAAGGRVAAVTALLSHGADPATTGRVVDVAERDRADREAKRFRDRRLAALHEIEEEARAQAADAEEENAESDESPEGEGSPEAGPPGNEETTEEETTEGETSQGETIEGENTEGEGAPEGGEPPQTEEAAETEEGVPAETAREPDEEVGEEQEGESGEEVSEEGTAPAESEEEKEEPERPPSYAELVGAHGGLTALLYAAREGHTDTVLTLLDAGANIDQVSDGDHTSPLLIATINGHFDLSMRLLERGAEPNLASDAGATPLYATLNVRWAPRAGYPQQHAYRQQKTGYLPLMAALLEAGADPNVQLEKHLWYTSFNFDHLLNSTGATPFWRAAYATDVEAMRLLVAHGADPTIPTRKLPRRRFRPQGADEEEPEDHSGLPPVPVGGPAVYPIHAAAGAGYGEGFAGHSHQHVPDGWLPAIKYLVEELGVDVNVRDHQAYTPLHHAAARGDMGMVLYLTLQGADVRAVSRRGQTTADMANGPVQRIQPYPETLALLEKLGAKNNDNCVSC